MQRAVIVGASSLLGKELAEELNRGGNLGWELTLLDDAEAAGQVTAAGDEPLVIQPLTSESFVGANVVFFAADTATTQAYSRHATASGAAVVDVTGALAGEPNVLTRAPLLSGAGLAEAHLSLTTEVVVSCHPASLMLSFLCARLQDRWGEHARVAATLLLPASEQGKAGVDELHEQTVALLSFQTLPRDVYDTQVAFSLNAEFGPEARVRLGEVSNRITNEMQALLGGDAAARCAFQCVQVPVFHGFSASVSLEFDEPVEPAEVRSALEQSGLLHVLAEAEPAPNSSVTSEEEGMLASLRISAAAPGRSAWLWLVGDALRLSARNAVACAGELLAMRPAGRVQ